MPLGIAIARSILFESQAESNGIRCVGLFRAKLLLDLLGPNLLFWEAVQNVLEDSMGFMEYQEANM